MFAYDYSLCSLLMCTCSPIYSFFPYTTLFRSLAIMVGGDPRDVDEARPVLAAMGANIIHVGPVDDVGAHRRQHRPRFIEDRKSTRLNSSHTVISYAVFCLKKKTKTNA